jgi:CHASE2 domain-containing sensor protein
MLFSKKKKNTIPKEGKKESFFASVFNLKNFFHYDNLGASALVVALLLGLGNLEFEALNPIGDAFSDVEITDVLFSHLGKNEGFRQNVQDGDTTVITDSNIVIVNVGGLDKTRRDIAFMINAINMGDPKIVALDVFFESMKQDSIGDLMLQEAFEMTENLVLTTEMLGYDHESNSFDSLKITHPFFNQHANNGYANMVTEDEAGRGQFNVCRKFHTRSLYKKDSSNYPSFPVRICELFDSNSVALLDKRNRVEEHVNFVGNITTWEEILPDSYKLDRMEEWGKKHFMTYEHSTVINTFFAQIGQPLPYPDYMPIDPEAFKDKIVLIGYVGNTLDIDTGEDKFFTPLNEKYVGKANKDMYGIVLHANIISTILRKNFINVLPNIWKHIIGIFLVYFTFALFRPIYSDYKVWYDGVTKALGISISLIILFIIGIIFARFNYEIQFGGLYFGCILLAGDFLEIYYGLIKNIGRKIKGAIQK